MPYSDGFFLTVEGVEGGGKSSALEIIKSFFESQGRDVMITREPGGTVVGEAIREVLLSNDLPPMHEDTELLLMFAARAEHLHHKILPALKTGKVVISDRFTDATYAYQGAGRGIDKQRIGYLESWTQAGFRPDLTLVFDLDAHIGLERVKTRGDSDRIEQENIDFFNRIRVYYQSKVKQDPKRYCCIDASKTIQQVHQQVIRVLKEKGC